jgi:hypothetical protein
MILWHDDDLCGADDFVAEGIRAGRHNPTRGDTS